MKNKIYRNDDTVLRVLSEKGGSVLVIDCVKKSMPKWITTAAISNFVECSEIELLSLTSMVIPDIDSLDASSKEFMHQEYKEDYDADLDILLWGEASSPYEWKIDWDSLVVIEKSVVIPL